MPPSLLRRYRYAAGTGRTGSSLSKARTIPKRSCARRLREKYPGSRPWWPSTNISLLHRPDKDVLERAGGGRQRLDLAALRPQQIHRLVHRLTGRELEID